MRDLLDAVRKALASARASAARPKPKDAKDRRSAGPEYAIAGSFGEFMIWRSADREGRSHVIYLGTADRAEQVARKGSRGVLHRIGDWQHSPAREAAERLEA